MDRSNPFSSELLDFTTNTVTPGPNLTYIVCKHKMLRRPSDGLIFIAGGKQKISEGNIKEDLLMSYDFTTDTWNMTYTPMSIGRISQGFAMTSDETKLIVAGGKAKAVGNPRYSETDSVEIYTMASDSWTQGMALPVINSFASLAVGDSLIALTAEENTVYEYDMMEDSWAPKVNIFSSAVKFDSDIILLGETYPYCG